MPHPQYTVRQLIKNYITEGVHVLPPMKVVKYGVGVISHSDTKSGAIDFLQSIE